MVVDEMGVVEIGVYKMKVDQMGSGRYRHTSMNWHIIDQQCSKYFYFKAGKFLELSSFQNM